MTIIDSHQHLGRSMFSGVVTTEEDLIAAMDEHGVEVSLVMPQPTRDDIPAIHDGIAESARRQPGRILGVASISPWWSGEDYDAEADRCVRELGFVAIKHHPLGHNIPPDHPGSEKVFRAAERLGVPVIVHTGLGSPFALPSLCIPPARRHPDCRIILAHAGWGLYSAEAMVAAEVCANIYLEPSWCPAYMAKKMVERIGAERVLFGSDHLTNLPVELVKYRSIGLSADALAAVLGGTAERVFALKR